MSEKKKVQVVVGSASGSASAAPGATSTFDFSQFQQQVYGDELGSAPHSNGGHGPRSSQQEDLFATAYQVRKSSIVDGLTSEALVDEHRKSIVAFAMREVGSRVHQQDLGGITLSKRHQQSKIEYEADLDDTAYREMQTYTFGDGPDAASQQPGSGAHS